jgi:hypothetical protein
VIGLLIILRDPLPNFGGRGPDDRIEVRVVVRVAAEDLDSQGPFFQFPWVSIQRTLYDIAEKSGIPLTVLEERICENPFQLGLDLDASNFGFGHGGRNQR